MKLQVILLLLMINVLVWIEIECSLKDYYLDNIYFWKKNKFTRVISILFDMI